ncbi:MAG: hypothetical protein ABJB66_00525 [Gemmatimonadaceae bacterium]
MKRATSIFLVSFVAGTLALANTAQLSAQSSGWTGVNAGSDDELYLRSLQILGVIPATSWAVRPLSNASLDSAQRVINVKHPWSDRFANNAGKSSSLIAWRGAALNVDWNSAFPWGGNDGAQWKGRGVSGTLTTGFLFRWKPLTIRAEPILVYAQNSAFDVLPTESGTTNPFVDRMRPDRIDLPDRFGNNALQRLDAGESEIKLEAHGLTASLSNRNMFIGPAFKNALLVDANAPGFAHLSMGTSDGIYTPIGRFSGVITYARLAQSAFAPDKRQGSRLASATVISWRPPHANGVELGAVRFYHRDWPADGLVLGDLKIPFGSFAHDRELFGAQAPDNQLLSLFGRLVSVQAGLELFVDYGRNDRGSSKRDLTVEPEQNAAWSVGFLKVVGQRNSEHFWTTRAEYLNGRVTSIEVFRPQATFYEHFTITQGHTNLGQLLGSPLLERTGGFEVAVDRWGKGGKLGAMLQERSMPLTLGVGVPANAARAQWALQLNGTQHVRNMEYGMRAGVVWDFNRTANNNAENFFIGGSVRIGR